MKLQSLGLAALILVLSASATAQDSRKDQTALLLHLEDARSADVPSWVRILESRDDPRFFGRVLRGLGRVGEPELKPLLAAVLDKADIPWTRDVQRGAAIAVGLFGDPDLLPRLAARATPRDVFFALGLMKKLPAGGQAPIAAWTDEGAESRAGPEIGESTFTDPVVAALRWGASIPEPVFLDLAKRTLLAKDAPADRRAAAVDYFARSKAVAPADTKPLLTELLLAGDPELAGLAARALAKSEDAGDPEARAIENAFFAGVDRVAQVDRIRALAAVKSPAAADALGRAISLSRSDPAVRRTVMEGQKSVAWDKVRPESRRVAAAQVRAIVQPGEGEAAAPPDVRAAAVVALAAVAPAQFLDGLPGLRLAAPWQVRAALAEGLVSLEGPDQPGAREWFHRLLKDPDRRVRIATNEAIADNVKKAHKFTMIAAWSSASVFLNQVGLESESSVSTADPVELGVIAKLYATKYFDAPKTFIEDATSLIPHHEVEALQSVLDLAGSLKSEKGNEVLQSYLKSPEISLRKRAKDLLAKNGIIAKEESAPDSRPQLDTDRADWLFENPAPGAVIETSRGSITIRLFAVDAPLTVQNFLRLGKAGFYDGILWHRVVPAFVAQAGCPRGDGWGGPGYTIRCEVNDRTYRRGSVGMALAGKDTGGCQFFICHRALPHLDGRYTLFGQVTEGMDVVDRLTQEDVILKVREL